MIPLLPVTSAPGPSAFVIISRLTVIRSAPGPLAWVLR